MVSQIQADLLDFPGGCNVIAHSCNCLNTMGAGIARQIKERYPEAYKADTKAYNDAWTRDKAESSHALLGNFSYTHVNGNSNLWLYNLYTQFDFGRDRRRVSYDALVQALEKMRETLRMWQVRDPLERGYRVGVPYKLSCKNAGGSWKVVEAILWDIFDKSNIDLVIVRNPKYDPVDES